VISTVTRRSHCPASSHPNGCAAFGVVAACRKVSCPEQSRKEETQQGRITFRFLHGIPEPSDREAPGRECRQHEARPKKNRREHALRAIPMQRQGLRAVPLLRSCRAGMSVVYLIPAQALPRVHPPVPAVVVGFSSTPCNGDGLASPGAFSYNGSP